ncbi:putative pentatricopeptide repeat-containing protein At1g68930 [Oryza brachyantha]|uniref:putative pentatricopeptide repeat-containing protein At1g68930 n=1 Tax=Oryza brachyantha TaxID=4533 RepID=UPI001ADAFDB8|nr:putative pentatricopeptide repeat-containing protein At1g68930 [Oryza brachyantha]
MSRRCPSWLSPVGERWDAASLTGALKAAGARRSAPHVVPLHAVLLKLGLSAYTILATSLAHLALRCGLLEYARELFDEMPHRDVVSWTSLITGHAHHDACGELALLMQGMQIHAKVIRGGFVLYVVIRNSLVDMYAKCGCVDSAELVFNDAMSSDAVLWITMISAYGKFGRVYDAISMFDRMPKLGIKQDGVAYLAVLSACSHSGLVKEGWNYFKLMFHGPNSVKIEPKHYGCMADLLCRSGYLEEALDFIRNMPFDSSVAAWSALLNSCRIHGNAKLGQLAASRLLQLDPNNHSNWVALSNVHASEINWHDTLMIRESMSSS